MTASHEIGGNNPPAFEAHSLHIEDLFSSVASVPQTVQDDEQEKALDDLLTDLRQAKKAADTERAAEKKPHDDAAAAVQARWKPLLARCDMAAVAIKDLLTPYRDAKQKAKNAAAAKAREEAAEKLAAAQAALKQPDDLEARFDAETQFAAAKKLTAVANKLDRAPTGLRTTWGHRIVNRRELLEHVMVRYPEDLADLLNGFVRSKVNEGVRAMPGVEITADRRAA